MIMLWDVSGTMLTLDRPVGSLFPEVDTLTVSATGTPNYLLTTRPGAAGLSTTFPSRSLVFNVIT